jgi:hypothetical protein
MSAGRRSWRAVPRGVWALGVVSLFMDVSSELIHALLPLLLVDSLGVGVARLWCMDPKWERNSPNPVRFQAIRT